MSCRGWCFRIGNQCLVAWTVQRCIALIWKTLEQHQHVLCVLSPVWLCPLGSVGEWAAECQSNQSAESHESKKQGNKWAVSMLALNIVQQDTMFLWMVWANWPQHDPSLPIAVVRKARSDRVQRVIHIEPHMDPGLHPTETFNRNGGCYWHWD